VEETNWQSLALRVHLVCHLLEKDDMQG